MLLTLDRALLAQKGKGRPIEIPFHRWARLVDFRTGDLAVLAGAPGGGKSTTAINWAHRTKDAVLYLVQDSPRSVQNRFAALSLRRNVHDILEEDNDYWVNLIREMGVKRDELILSAGANTVDMIEHKIIALTEWLMAPPHVVFVDNLIDMKSDEAMHIDNPFHADILTRLKQVAIERDVGVVLLHHVSRGGDHADGESPLRMTDLLFGGEREARHVWGVYRGWTNKNMHLQVLKQQDGRADPNGNLEVELQWLPKEGRLYNG